MNFPHPSHRFSRTARARRLIGPFVLWSALSVIIIGGLPFQISGADNPPPANTPSPNWYYATDSGQPLNLNPINTVWLYLEGKFTAITLQQDQFSVFTQDENLNWAETQSFKPPETQLTVFTIRDLDSDGTPEIIAGTLEPGYIYIYKRSNGTWILANHEKYVWSTIIEIAAGKFDGQQVNLLVQNQDGFLYLLKITDQSPDIVWKSPTVWRQIDSLQVLDLDNDGKDEMIVCYKTGGIGVLKLVNNQIVSVWDNFIWGKALSFAVGDWDNDKLPELLIGTSQKIIYVLGSTSKVYQFEDRITQFTYIAETVSLIRRYDKNQLLTTDTAGKLHWYEYDPKAKPQWTEQFYCQTGRIAQMLPVNNSEFIMLWSQNRKLILLNAFKTGNFKLKTNDTLYDLSVSPIYLNNTIYIAPKALNAIAESKIKYQESKTAFTVNLDQAVLEVAKSAPDSFKFNNETQTNENQLVIKGNNLYLSDDAYLKLFNITTKVDPTNRVISMINAAR